MAASDNVFPVGDCCEICGVPLGDEVVIQEFADGSLARLCKECAAGTVLDERGDQIPEPEPAPPAVDQTPSFSWPEARPGSPQPEEELDPLEKTRELLTPINELIALQREMQNALERLAVSLERFAAEMLTESQGKTAVESRLRTLEMELEKTRALLEQTDLGLATAPALETRPVAEAAAPFPVAAEEQAASEERRGPAEEVRDERPLEPLTSALAEAATPVAGPATTTAAASSPVAAPVSISPAEPVSMSAESPVGPEPELETGFRLEEVQLTQRYYNESRFVSRIRDIIENLGKPRANLTRVPGPTPRALVTIFWDIVWYQYLVDLRRDLPADHPRVALYREGMDLDQLAYYFKEKNAIVNDDGRLDASELEVRLLSDPSALITEMSAEEARLLDDATEEIWDQRSAPEFKWDD